MLLTCNLGAEFKELIGQNITTSYITQSTRETHHSSLLLPLLKGFLPMLELVFNQLRYPFLVWGPLFYLFIRETSFWISKNLSLRNFRLLQNKQKKFHRSLKYLCTQHFAKVWKIRIDYNRGRVQQLFPNSSYRAPSVLTKHPLAQCQINATPSTHDHHSIKQ